SALGRHRAYDDLRAVGHRGRADRRRAAAGRHSRHRGDDPQQRQLHRSASDVNADNFRVAAFRSAPASRGALLNWGTRSASPKPIGSGPPYGSPRPPSFALCPVTADAYGASWPRGGVPAPATGGAPPSPPLRP